MGADFLIGPDVITVKFSNLSPDIQRVQLQNGLFIGAGGAAQELVTGDMSYANRNASPRPVILRSGDSEKTTLIPQRHIQFKMDGMVFTDQITRPTGITSLNMAKEARNSVGDTLLQLILPVQSRGSVRQYRFKFLVSNAQLPSDRIIQAMLDGKISKGMHMEHVRKVKRDPRETQRRDGRTIWYYGTVTDNMSVIFESGKVTEIK